MSLATASVLLAAGTPSPEPGGAGLADARTWLIALVALVAIVGLTWWLRRR